MRNILFGLGALVVAWFMVSGYIEDRGELRQVRSAGKSAVVDPITQYTETRRKGSSTYSADFSFRTEDGRAVKARKSFPSEVLEAMKRGDPVGIHYLPGNPSAFRFDAEKSDTFILLFGIGAAVVGVFLVWVGLRGRKPEPQPQFAETAA